MFSPSFQRPETTSARTCKSLCGALRLSSGFGSLLWCSSSHLRVGNGQRWRNWRQTGRGLSSRSGEAHGLATVECHCCAFSKDHESCNLIRKQVFLSSLDEDGTWQETMCVLKDWDRSNASTALKSVTAPLVRDTAIARS